MNDLLLDLCLDKGIDAEYASSGNELHMPCPLCGDHKPRLYINRLTGRWMCFHCDEKGGLEAFLMEALLYDPIQAGRLMAQMRDEAPTARRERAPVKPTEIEWPPFAMSFEEEKVDGRYWSYLVDRGIAANQIAQYDIRWCPVGKYAERVIIPIMMGGVLRGWMARLIREPVGKEQKVLHPLGMKSSLLLFGLDDVAPDSAVVLTEGPFDALRIGGAVATMGAKMSPQQRHLLQERGITTVVILYDGDNSGRRAAKRVGRELVAAGFTVEIANLPDGVDPGSATMLQLIKAIQEAVPVTLTSNKELERKMQASKEKNS